MLHRHGPRAVLSLEQGLTLLLLLLLLFVLQNLHSSLSSDRRVVDLVQLVSELSPPGTESEESKALTQSLGELGDRWTETVAQLAARRQELDDQLSEWAQFDDCYQRLISAVTQLHTSLGTTDTLTAEDAIARIEQVSASCYVQNKHCRFFYRTMPFVYCLVSCKL